MRLIILIISLSLALNVAYASQLSNAQIKDKIIKDSIASYLATFAVCPCPYSKDKHDQPCGDMNAWTTGGAGHRSVYCYPSDVPASMVEQYRNK